MSVPTKPGDLGKPIGVDVGGGVGPYYQQNQHVGVDWMDGQVRYSLISQFVSIFAGVACLSGANFQHSWTMSCFLYRGEEVR